MLSRIDLRGTVPGCVGHRDGRLPRARVDVDRVLPEVTALCEAVRVGGLPAVRELTARFDGVDLPDPRVPGEALVDALAGTAPELREAMAEAARRIRLVHEAQRPADTTVTVVPGGRVTERYLPVGRAGLYAPGGLVAYPSSVLMNVVPAQVAGVGEVAVASPPRPEFGGRPHPGVLAACALLGVREVYAVGGAQAVALLAYGADGPVPVVPVDVVTGPGNVYVAAAKRVVRGRVAVDGEAGPTEIAILADQTADPEVLAADLIAQAEHDPLAACLLVTPDERIVEATAAALRRRLPLARHRDRVGAALAGQSAFVLVDDLAAAVAVVDSWAPEHLEVLTADPAGLARAVRNAGAVFVGPHTPVALGDYLAGSNHVLPTGGTARHSGGLSVQVFLRTVHEVEYTRDALAAAAPHVAALGAAEDLGGHVEAVAVRLR